jgi:hypothetical protein
MPITPTALEEPGSEQPRPIRRGAPSAQDTEEAAVSEAQKATAARREAVEPVRKFKRDLMRVARRVFRKEPEQLKKLEIYAFRLKVPSNQWVWPSPSALTKVKDFSEMARAAGASSVNS